VKVRIKLRDGDVLVFDIDLSAKEARDECTYVMKKYKDVVKCEVVE